MPYKVTLNVNTTEYIHHKHHDEQQKQKTKQKGKKRRRYYLLETLVLNPSESVVWLICYQKQQRLKTTWCHFLT